MKKCKHPKAVKEKRTYLNGKPLLTFFYRFQMY